MDTQKMAGYLAAMTVLGLITFAVLAWLVEWREGQPVEPPGAVEAPAVREQSRPLDVVAAGARVSAETARIELDEGRRSAAAHAMDAGWRAAEVAHHAASGEARRSFEYAVSAFKRARHALQMGDPQTARAELRRAAEDLYNAEASIGETGQMPPMEQWPQYEGALLVNAHGVRIGEMVAVRTAGDAPTAVLKVGGPRDALGFIDLGGVEWEVPAERLLYGRPQSIGMTKVALPTYERTVDLIEDEWLVFEGP